MIQPQVEYQFRSERPHSPENYRPDDKPNEPIGRGKVDLRAGGFGFGGAQDVVWDRCKIKPARKRTDYRDASPGWQGRQLAGASSVALGGLPVLVQLVQREVLEILSFGLRLLLHDPKARLEAAGRGAKGVLRVDAELAGDIDQAEQQVAELRLAGLDCARLTELLELLADLVQRAVDVRPVEAHVRRAALQRPGPLQRRQGPLDPVERRLPAVFRRLERLPIPTHFLGTADDGRAENVGMAANQLLTDRIGHVAHGEVTSLCRDLGLHQDLEQDVAQLFAELGHRLLVDRLQDLVGFLEHAGAQRRASLLAIPGTAQW